MIYINKFYKLFNYAVFTIISVLCCTLENKYMKTMVMNNFSVVVPIVPNEQPQISTFRYSK